MALTKIGSIGINTGIQFAGVTTVATLNASDNVLSVGGTVNFVSDVSIGGTVSIAGTLTYEDVTNIDAVGLITARNGVVVGSGITLSKDGDIFATGVTTATTFVGALTGNVSGGTVAGSTGTFTDAVTIVKSSGPLLELTTNTSAADATLRLSEGATGSTSNGGGMFYSGSDNKLHITCGTDSTTKRITINRDDGLVGIGSDAPTHNLDIHASSNTYLKLLRSGYNPFYIGNAAGEGVLESTGATFIKTGGSERARIDSSGVTMLGSGAIATPKVTGPGGLDVSQYGISICMGGSSGSSGQARANSTNKEARLVIPHYTNAEEPVVAIAAFPSSGSNQLNFGGGTSLGNSATEIIFHTASDTTTTGSNQKLKIGSDGKITVTSPAIIHSGSSAGSLTLYGGATNHGGKIQMQGGNGDATIRFYSQPSTSSPAERLRISGLRVLHNCTSNTGGASSGVYVQEYLGHAYNAVKIRDTANTGTANVLVMIAGSNVSGTITQNGSSASFNTSSDYRLKENEVEISDGISRVKNLKPYKFNWKSDPTKIVDGFFAHEAQSVVPESVTGEKDEVADSDIEGKGIKKGDEIHQVMDHSKLVPLLTAALKEAISKIEVLETEVAALKSS